jgi:RNA polymerase sigma-54 factor
MLTTTELQQTIETELAENPVLEIIEESNEEEKGIDDFQNEMSLHNKDDLNNDSYNSSSEKTKTESPKEIDKNDENNEKSDIQEDHFEESDIDWSAYYDDEFSLQRTGSSNSINYNNEETTTFENYTASSISLREHLEMQLRNISLSENEFALAKYLINAIKPDGYLKFTNEEIHNDTNFEIDIIEQMIELIQNFDPPGVGARTLEECLLIQYSYSDDFNPLVETIIQNHLTALGENKIPQLAKLLGVKNSDIQEAAKTIKNLNPKPGYAFNIPDETDYIIPDIIVIEKNPGEFIVQLNEKGLPRLRISSITKKIIDKYKIGECSKLEYKYIKNNQDKALWLMKSIHQWRTTLYNVSDAIVKFQKEFMEKGVRFLKPLTLKELAETVGVHESTVGRATTNKYIQTPRGIFELKYFFSSKLKKKAKLNTENETNDNNTSASSKCVKDMIKEIIESENKRKPFSDQKITNILIKKGINIARRTVLKYRESMDIPSSSKRKIFI